MKVLLISNYLPDRQESMLRYARLIHGELRARGIDAVIAYPPVVLTRLTGKGGRVGKWVAYIDKYLLAPSFLRRKMKSADLVHVCDHSNSMYLPLAGKKPSVITCHDLLAVFAAEGRFPGVEIGGTGRRLQRWIARELKRAQHVLCVSKKTEQDIQTFLDFPASKTMVVYHSLNWDYHPVAAEETEAVLLAHHLDPSAAYILHVGSNSWYKNRPAVVAIFAQLRKHECFRETRLILAGKPWNAELRAAVAASGVATEIDDVGEVSNQELRALYSGARLFLFPSREEGFGWPILEAQACGCPVATTARAPMTEVAGKAAIFINPDWPEQAADAIVEAVGHFDEMRRNGLKNATHFSIDRSMTALLDLYGKTMAAATRNV